MDSGPGRQKTLNHPVQLVSQTFEFFLDGMEFALDVRERLPLPGLAGLYLLPQPGLTELHLLPLLGHFLPKPGFAGLHLLPQPGFTVIDFAFQELTGGQ